MNINANIAVTKNGKGAVANRGGMMFVIAEGHARFIFPGYLSGRLLLFFRRCLSGFLGRVVRFVFVFLRRSGFCMFLAGLWFFLRRLAGLF